MPSTLTTFYEVITFGGAELVTEASSGGGSVGGAASCFITVAAGEGTTAPWFASLLLGVALTGYVLRMRR